MLKIKKLDVIKITGETLVCGVKNDRIVLAFHSLDRIVDRCGTGVVTSSFFLYKNLEAHKRAARELALLTAVRSRRKDGRGERLLSNLR